MSIIESIRRANSGLRYFFYRRLIGNPIAFGPTVREWFRRYRFERSNRA